MDNYVPLNIQVKGQLAWSNLTHYTSLPVAVIFMTSFTKPLLFGSLFQVLMKVQVQVIYIVYNCKYIYTSISLIKSLLFWQFETYLSYVIIKLTEVW